MELRLEGRFSYISKYNKLIIVPDHVEETLAKLDNQCTGTLPYHTRDITVSMGKTRITPDIRAMVGLDCIVHVKLRKYKFKSTRDANRGESVEGTQLILTNIRRKYAPTQ